MKKYKSISGLLLVLIFASTNLFGQTYNQKANRNKIEAAKIGFFSKEMQLTPDEAKIFWPLYDAYERAIQDEKTDRKQNLEEVDVRLNEMSDEQINKLIDSRLQQAENALKARKNFIAAIRKELSPMKVALFFKAENQFKRMLLERVNENVRDKTMPAKPIRN